MPEKRDGRRTSVSTHVERRRQGMERLYVSMFQDKADLYILSDNDVLKVAKKAIK